MKVAQYMFILLFIASLFLGRAFCSWACPLGAAQEILSPLKKKFAVKGKNVKWINCSYAGVDGILSEAITSREDLILTNGKGNKKSNLFLLLMNHLRDV